MWSLIILSVLAVYAAGLIYISLRCAGVGFVRKWTKNKKPLSVLLCLAFFLLLTGALALIFNLVNALICMIHLYVFGLLSDLAGFLIGKIRKKKVERFVTCASAFLLCAVYLCFGWFFAHHVFRTDYSFSSSKLTQEYRIVQISDSHIGAIFDVDAFGAYMEEINSLSPDVVVVTGDFVDDDTKREEMLGGCAALGKLKTRFGVYFVWGNHDSGYFSSEGRGWTAEELRKELLDNRVTLLEDRAELIDGAFYLVGRLDRSARGGRKSAKELVASLDKSKYIVMLDHQPNDFQAEADACADLVLCGHTHGGQLLPATYAGVWIGAVDMRYGHKKLENTDFVVSSGIGCWSIKFKTGCISEYVVIDLNGEQL